MRNRLAIVVIAAVLALAGCGAKDAASSDTGPGDTEVATGGRLFKTADQETAKLGSDAQPGAFPRTVKHALGETTLEKKSERRMSLSTATSGRRCRR